MVLGLRGLINPIEGLRYSLLPPERLGRKVQYHEVKVNIEFRNRDDCYYSDTTSLTWGSSDFEASLFVDYIYLDTDERRRFAQVSHEYLLFSKRSKAATRQHADPVGAKKCRLSAWPQPLSCASQMAICCC
jgi:hypothetical protein